MSPRSLAWKPSADRRRRRTKNPSLAASYYLSEVRERCSIEAIVLAEDARALSGAGDGLEDLASAGSLAVEGNEIDLDGVDYYAHRIDVGARTFVLATRGRRVDRLREVERDLSRIFS